MANGLEAERVLLEGLRARGFHLAELSPEDAVRLDTVYKLDGVVVALPVGGCFFPPPVGLQITTHCGDWPKRAEFPPAARATGLRRLMYAEIQEEPVAAEHVNAVAAALLALFLGPDQPEVALVRARPNSYTIRDLNAALAGYRQWLSQPLSGVLQGSIAHWDPGRQFGFISASAVNLPDYDNPSARASFFFHRTGVVDSTLRNRLESVAEGSLVGTTVEFEEGELPDESRWRKSAVKVRL